MQPLSEYHTASGAKAVKLFNFSTTLSTNRNWLDNIFKFGFAHRIKLPGYFVDKS